MEKRKYPNQTMTGVMFRFFSSSFFVHLGRICMWYLIFKRTSLPNHNGKYLRPLSWSLFLFIRFQIQQKEHQFSEKLSYKETTFFLRQNGAILALLTQSKTPLENTFHIFSPHSEFRNFMKATATRRRRRWGSHHMGIWEHFVRWLTNSIQDINNILLLAGRPMWKTYTIGQNWRWILAKWNIVKAICKTRMSYLFYTQLRLQL